MSTEEGGFVTNEDATLLILMINEWAINQEIQGMQL